MKYIDEFRNKPLIGNVAQAIRVSAGQGRAYKFMEVCGTHTTNIFRFALKSMLPENITLMSGPGCPVCVTPNDYLDKAVYLANLDRVIITTFGDMLKVPGSYSSLERERAGGRSVKVVYSTMDALEIARQNPDKEVVFLGIGFETTAPTVAQSVLIAKKEGIRNYSVLCGHKTMPEVLEAMVKGGNTDIDGFMLPGHVSAVIGPRPYEFLARKYGKRCVVAGFEPLDIMEAILMLVKQKTPKVEVEYARVINRNGNERARKAMKKVFEKTPSVWRGIGRVKDSGLAIRKRYSDFDAETKFNIRLKRVRQNKDCICGDVLRGSATPVQCKLFAKSCTPENPAGFCMVSSEGACAAYYKYRV